MATRSTNATEMRDLREQIQQIRNEFKELSAISKELAAERASHLTDRTKDLYQTGLDKFTEVQDDVADRVRTNPMKSLLIAAGIGLVVGCLSRRS